MKFTAGISWRGAIFSPVRAHAIHLDLLYDSWSETPSVECNKTSCYQQLTQEQIFIYSKMLNFCF